MHRALPTFGKCYQILADAKFKLSATLAGMKKSWVSQLCLTEKSRSTSMNTCQESSNKTNVILVWLSTKENPQAEMLVYALLDIQSDSTFIGENVCSQDVHLVGPMILKLTTLLGTHVAVECRKSKGLRFIPH